MTFCGPKITYGPPTFNAISMAYAAAAAGSLPASPDRGLPVPVLWEQVNRPGMLELSVTVIIVAIVTP